MSDSLWPDGLQHTRHLCPPPSPKVCPSSCLPSSHLILLCSLPLCPQSFPASRTFPVSQLFASNDQNTGVSASASVLPMIQGWFPLRLTGSISCWPRDSQESSLAPQFEDINSSDNRGRDGWVASLTHWNEFEQALRHGDGQGSLACCSPWGRKEFDTTECLNNNNCPALTPYVPKGKTTALTIRTFVGLLSTWHEIIVRIVLTYRFILMLDENIFVEPLA